MVTLFITTGSTGLSRASVGVLPIFFTTSRPLVTLPNTVCLPSRCGVGARVMKNWLPLVLGPAFAMLSTPAASCLLGLPRVSSSNW